MKSHNILSSVDHKNWSQFFLTICLKSVSSNIFRLPTLNNLSFFEHFFSSLLGMDGVNLSALFPPSVKMHFQSSDHKWSAETYCFHLLKCMSSVSTSDWISLWVPSYFVTLQHFLGSKDLLYKHYWLNKPMLRGLRVIRKEATEKDKESSCNFVMCFATIQQSLNCIFVALSFSTSHNDYVLGQ